MLYFCIGLSNKKQMGVINTLSHKEVVGHVYYCRALFLACLAYLMVLCSS